MKRLRDGGEALGHADGEAEIEREREARAGAVESAGDGIEDGGVDEAVVWAEAVTGDGEVGGGREIGGGCGGGAEDFGGERAEGFGGEGLGLGAEKEAGGGLLLLRDLVGVEVVGGGENQSPATEGAEAV